MMTVQISTHTPLARRDPESGKEIVGDRFLLTRLLRGVTHARPVALPLGTVYDFYSHASCEA